MEKTGNCFDDRRFPRAVGADEAYDLPLVDREGGALDGQESFVTHGNVID
jgi:hypothetical protein